MEWVYSAGRMYSKKTAIPRARVLLSPQQVMAGITHLRAQDDQAIIAFEQAFAHYIGVKHAIAVGSAKAGLVMLMRAMGAKPGQGVIIPGYNVPEVPAVLRALNLQVIAADIGLENYNIDPKDVKKYAGKADFLIITHLYGSPARLDALVAEAGRGGLRVIEDCAQALGAGFEGKRLGASGNPAIFSFGMMKNLVALGGGMVTTSDDRIAARIRTQRAMGACQPTGGLVRSLVRGIVLAAGTDARIFPLFFSGLRLLEKGVPGLVYRAMKSRPAQWDQGILNINDLVFRMHPAQAAMGLVGLWTVDRAAQSRIRNAEILLGELQGLPGISLPQQVDGADPAWTNFVVRVNNREHIKQRMLDCGFDTTWGYLAAIDRIADAGDCPNARVLERQNLYLPLGADSGKEVMRAMARCLARAVETGEK